ncbi:hypothetical protein [Afifella marina]|uniref:hypothetical protein n=1 Tax=Afifella marina TaxID=1080 RepID=UPI001FCD0227|nr:hypothetical protein [Afifella marina]
MLAIAAQDEAAKRKIGVDVLARRHPRTTLEAVEDLLVCLQGDQAFVPRLAQGNVPFGHFEISGIGDARQNVGDPLIANLSIRQVCGKVGLGFQEALHFDLCVEASRGVAFQRFLNDRG